MTGCAERQSRRSLETRTAAPFDATAVSQAHAQAHAEVTLAFVNRWAALRRLPRDQRAAAAAALRLEQQAALRARTDILVRQARNQLRSRRSTRCSLFAMRAV